MSLLRSSSMIYRYVSKSRSLDLVHTTIGSEARHYDIIIAGGGMVGTTLACTLGKNKRLSNKKILLLEGSKEFNWKLTEKYSNRVVAINQHTQNLFKEIGVWKHIADARFGTVRKMQVWDGLSDAMITFSHDNLLDIIAFIVENDLILDAVNKETKAISNISIVNEAKIKEYILKNTEQNENKIRLENGTEYTCDLLLGCDGANSIVRKTMGIQYVSWNYDQTAVVATLKLSEATDNFVAWQRFLPTGPIALLPLKDNLSSLVWTTTPDEAKRLLALPGDQFVDSINDALWKVFKTDDIIHQATKTLDDVMKSLNCPSNAVRQLPPHISGFEEDSRAAFPLGFGHSTNYVSNGVALVGDAAHRVHPMAGQGVNLGFGDAACLNRVLGEAVYSGSKLGEIDKLRDYETERQRHNLPTMLAIDGLQKLYNTDLTLLVLLRTLGLQFTNSVNPLKKIIMESAA